MPPLLLAALIFAAPQASPPPDPASDLRVVQAMVAEFAAAWNRGEKTLPGMIAGRDGGSTHREHTRLELDLETLSLKSASASPSATVEGKVVGQFKPAAGALWPVEPWKQAGARSPISIHLMRRPGEDWAIFLVRSAWDAPTPVY